MLWIPVDRSLELPLIKQIYTQIRERILSGQLPAGERLPSTRALAAELKVSRNVILEAYDQLLAEGFLVSRQGAGTFIATGAALSVHRESSPPPTDGDPTAPPHADCISFRSGIPALDAFPRRIWAKLSHQVWHEADAHAFGYGHPEGQPKLREVLAKYLFKTRGVSCRPDQIVITSGATQAMTIVSKLLLASGGTAVMEDPITQDIQTIFKASGASLYPVEVDTEGMQTDKLPQHLSPKLVFVTPSHQFPLGGTLPIQRRIELIRYAEHTGCILVEDDYDSEFRHDGPPVSSLQGLAPERTIYIGSFSKILLPALRIGYVVLPSHLIRRFRELKWFSDLHNASLDQLILAQFIEDGHLERHISRMKKMYRKRRDQLIHCLTETFGDAIEIKGESTGLHFVAKFQYVRFTEDQLDQLRTSGIEIYSAEDHAIEKGKYLDHLIFGYGHLQEEEIEEGVKRLAQFEEIQIKKASASR